MKAWDKPYRTRSQRLKNELRKWHFENIKSHRITSFEQVDRTVKAIESLNRSLDGDQ